MIAKNVANQIQFAMVSLSGALNSATPTVMVSQDGGSYAASHNTPTAVSGETGAWNLQLTAAEMNGNMIHCIITASGCFPAERTIYTESTWTSTLAGYLDTNVSSVAAAAAVQVWGAASRTLTGFGTLTTDTASAVWAATTRTLTALGSSLADEVWNRLRSAVARPAGSFGNYLDANVSSVGGVSLTSAQIADAVWDEPLANHSTPNTFGTGTPIDLAQTVGHTQTAGTLGRALQLIRAWVRGQRAYGVPSADHETLYDTDNSTIVAVHQYTPSGGPYTGRQDSPE